MTFKGPFQPKLFYDSMIILITHLHNIFAGSTFIKTQELKEEGSFAAHMSFNISQWPVMSGVSLVSVLQPVSSNIFIWMSRLSAPSVG